MDLEDYLAALTGPAMNWMANRGVAQRANGINDQATLYKMGQSGRAMDATSKVIASNVTPAAIAANDAAAKATLAGNLNNTVNATRGYEADPTLYGGKVSGDLTTRAASNRAAVADRLTRTIDQMSTIGAPAVRAQGDAARMATAAGTVAGANTASRNVGAAYGAAIDSVRPNPLLAFGAQLADGYNLARAQKRALAKAPQQTTDPYAPGYIGGTSEGE